MTTETTPAAAHEGPTDQARTAPRGLVDLTVALAALLTLNTRLGPLGFGAIDYDLDRTLDNQLLGLELVTVGLVVPALLLGAVLTARGRPAGPLAVVGPAGYAAYMFVQYVLGPEYASYSLTVLFHLLLTTVSGGLALWAWTVSGRIAIPPVPRRLARLHALLLTGYAGFVLLRYAGSVTGALEGAPIGEEFEAARTFFWSIYLLDLGVVVPTTLVAAWLSWRGTETGRRAVLAVVGWFALVPPSVAAMALVMLARDDPNASVPTVVLLTVASLVFAGVAVRLFWPLLRPKRDA
jgi:hypothetical protein